MSASSAVWCGVDVGGHRKGFHLAAVDTTAPLDAPRTGLDGAGAVEWIIRFSPAATAVDSSISAAPTGRSSRAGERRMRVRLAATFGRLQSSRQSWRDRTPYGWITHGFQLYEAL